MAERLVMIRHGALGERFRGRYIGSTDEPLSAEGRRQAASLAGPLARLIDGARLLVSPMRRASETAEIALGPVAALSVDSDIREIDFGKWEGMCFEEILASAPEAVEQWAAFEDDFAFPDGESFGSFRKRIVAAAERIAVFPEETAIIITHGGVIRFLICHFLGLRDRSLLLFDVRPASISELRINGGKGVLTLFNDRCHLDGLNG